MLSDAKRKQLREAFERMPAEAFVDYAQEVVREHGEDAQAWFLLGAGLHRLGRLEPALEAFGRTVTLEPEHVQALNAQAGLLAAVGRVSEARVVLENARRRFPDDATVLVNLGYLLEQQVEERERALGCYDEALGLDGSNRAALMNRGYLLTVMGRLAEAVENNRRFVDAHPQLATAHFNLAESLLASMRTDEALAASEAALVVDPAHAHACMVRGLALAELGRMQESTQAMTQAQALNPDARYRAVSVFEPNRTMASPPPDAEDIFLHRGFRHLMVCDWTHRDHFLREFELRMQKTLDASGAVRDYSFAYDMLGSPFDRLLHSRVMRALAGQLEDKARKMRPALRTHPKRDEARLRIGYVSPDFRDHLNARLTYPLFRLHDRKRFEVFAYSLHADDGSEIRKNVAAAADRFIDVSGRPAEEIADSIFEDGIDILVDLAGITTHSQPDIFAYRPAPLQASYLGFPGTLGADYIPYRITDRVATPAAQRSYWSEKLIFLPDTFYIYDEVEPLAATEVSRPDYGLPETGTVFCVFHNYYKIDPTFFAAWMRILQRVPGSVLWFMGRDLLAVENLKRETAAAGVSIDRLRFAPLEARDRYRARFRLADIYLDARWFNAMTTACDALWAGLPILTCPGEGFTSRVCASLLAASGLDECILPDLQAYEEKAVALARDKEALQLLKNRVDASRTRGCLFDSPSRVRQIEAAFEGMWQRYQAGKAPEDFDVAR